MSQPFAEGWVLTVEPGIYIPEEGIGIRLENDILVTADGPVDLMKDIPVEVGDVEALIDAVMAVANFAERHQHQLLELDVNPVLVMAQGQGVLAVDALIRIQGALNE
jgi:succinyl-CoA synthetase beta subunit